MQNNVLITFLWTFPYKLLYFADRFQKTDNFAWNKIHADLVRSGLRYLKEEIKKMNDDGKEIEKPSEIVDVVEKILELNNLNQQGQGSKILTLDQMLSRLPTSLAQLKAGNNSEKLKNEIRQLLYSLYCSKKLTKTLYNNLINTI